MEDTEKSFCLIIISSFKLEKMGGGKVCRQNNIKYSVVDIFLYKLFVKTFSVLQ